MERLTERFSNGQAAVAGCGNSCKFNYKYCEDNFAENCPTLAEIYEKLASYEDLEEQGLLPKFHLGDEFWTIRLGEVLKSKVVMLQQKKDGSWQYRFSQEITPEYHDTHNYKESEFGKRFFLTKEEAEQALARTEKENGKCI